MDHDSLAAGSRPSAGGSWLPRLAPREFAAFSRLIYDRCGINLQPGKLIMLSARLSRRMRILGIATYAEYLDYVSSPAGEAEELVPMIDVVTTNKTEFYREARHYGVLTGQILPRLAHQDRVRHVRLWSAGCSTGEEPYTLAMLLADWFAREQGSWRILASDISTRVLETARRAIYPAAAVAPLPPALRQRYVMRGKGPQAGVVRIVPELRRAIDFRRVNLIADEGFGLTEPVEIIFCRNVVIYFDRETQRRLFRRFFDQLVPGGHIVIGMSETLHMINDQFKQVTTSVYRKPHPEDEAHG